VWASPHKPPYGALLTQTSGGLQFRPFTGLDGYYQYLGLASTLLGLCAGHGGGSGYTSYAA